MKNTTISKLGSARNILVMLVFLYITLNHKTFTHNTENVRSSVINYTIYNPLQHGSILLHWGINYIMDFLRFREQRLEMERLALQMTALSNDLQQTKNINNELLNTLQSFQQTATTHQVKQVVKLLYSISTHNTKEIFFISENEVKTNNLVFNQKCLIGRVVKNEQGNYYILAYQDPQFRLPVYTSKTKIIGMIHGGESMLKFVPFDEFTQDDVEDGEELFTASSGDQFPDGIPIGKVIKNEETINVQTECKSYYTYALII